MKIQIQRNPTDSTTETALTHLPKSLTNFAMHETENKTRSIGSRNRNAITDSMNDNHIKKGQRHIKKWIRRNAKK